MCNENENNLIAQYKDLEIHHMEFISMDSPNAIDFARHLLKMSKFLINRGESIKDNLDCSNPKELAADYAQQALDLVDIHDHILKAESYLLLANARWFFPCPPHKENAILCEKAIAETSAWFDEFDGVNSDEEYLRVKQIRFIAKENRALYSHYANDFQAAINEYQSLLEETKKNGSDSACFTLIMKLANVLNDANRISDARALLFAKSTERLIASDNERFRLHVAQSHSHALSGRMYSALDDIHKALRYFNSNEFHVKTQGNLLIRAARYYIMMSAYEDAMTMLPDLIGCVDTYTGGEYKLNLAVVRAMLWVRNGDKKLASDALNKLDSMVSEIVENESSEELPDQYWDHAVLKAQYEQRYHGDQAAIAYIQSLTEIANPTIATMNTNQYPLLLIYCDAMINIGITKKLEAQIVDLATGSVFNDQWERWKAFFCVARWFLSVEQLAKAILWAKISCNCVLELSVPLLRSAKQRERITEEFMSPFFFLENALCLAARIPEAQSIRAFRLFLECELRFPSISDSGYQPFSGNNAELNLSDEEGVIYKKWNAICKKAVLEFEQGKTVKECIKSSGMDEFVRQRPKQIGQQIHLQYDPRSTEKRPANECFLSFWVNENQIRVVVESCVAQKTMILQITPQEMRRDVYQLRIAIEDGTEWQPLAMRLYTSLITPVADLITGVEKLILSVNDALRFLPMAILLDGNNYLIEKFELIYSDTGHVEPIMINDKAKIMFLGTTQHISDQKELNPVQELAQIQKQFTVETALIDQDWNMAAWKKSFTKQHSILHMCCHFNFMPHNSACSYLMLSDERKLDIGGVLGVKTWDGFDLIFLATCNSATGGENSISNTNISLSDAFISSGVKRVIASFRPVSDTRTEQFCANFYRLLRETSSVERALQLAQCQAIKMNNPVWSAYACWVP